MYIKSKKLFNAFKFVCLAFSVAALAACGESSEGNEDTTPPTTVTHSCTEVCDTCGGCTDLYCAYAACSTKCGDDKDIEYEFLATDTNAVLSGTTYAGDNGAGTTYLVMNRNSSILFTITSNESTSVSLVAYAAGLMDSNYRYLDDVTITVNGTAVSAETKIPYADYSNTGDFFNVGLGCVQLNEGENTILVTSTGATNSVYYTFSSIKLYTNSSTTLAWSDNIYANECDLCGICTDQICISGACDVHCMCDHTYKNDFRAASDQTVVEGMTKNTAEDCVGFNNNGTSVYITYYLYSPAAETGAGFYIYVTTSPTELLVTDVYTIYVNGVAIESEATIKAGEYWSNYHSIYVADIDLLEGENIIQLVTREGVYNTGDTRVYMHNLRSIIISSDVELSWSTLDRSNATLFLDTTAAQTEFNVGDTFSYNGLTVKYSASGEEEDAVDVTSYVIVTAPDLTSAGTKGVTVRYASVTTTYNVNVVIAEGEKSTYTFEAEDSNTVLLVEGTKDITVESTHVGTLYPGNLGAKIVFTVNSTKETTADLYMSVGERNGNTLSDVMSVTVNGEVIENTASWEGTGAGWAVYTTIYVEEIDLKEGLNVLTFEVLTNEQTLNGNTVSFNFDSISLYTDAFLSWYTPTDITVSNVTDDGTNLSLSVNDDTGVVEDIAYVKVEQKYYSVDVASEGNNHLLTVGNVGTDAGDYELEFLNSIYGKIATTSFTYSKE